MAIVIVIFTLLIVGLWVAIYVIIYYVKIIILKKSEKYFNII